jgi:dihydroorotate dehydrogenase electron transfer subunit
VPAAPPTPLRTDAVVVANAREGAACHRLRLLVPGWPGFEPGHFVMLSPGALGAVPRSDPLLPRPMAVYRAEGEELEVLYKVAGRGTALLAEARTGERVRLVGPLGRSFPPPLPGERALLVGGGTGIASLYELARRLASEARSEPPASGAHRASEARSEPPASGAHRAGEEVGAAVLLGARSAGELMGRADFAALGLPVRIATEDGSAGARGLVTELLEAELAAKAPARVYACGPTPMMRRCAELAAACGAPALASLENHMACGFGVCLGCAVPVRSGGFALVCRDGPVFAAGDVAWEGLP